MGIALLVGIMLGSAGCPRPPEPEQYVLTTDVSPPGSGIVSAEPPGMVYDSGSTVSLTASANSGWQFDHWEADFFSGNANPASFRMNSNCSITAVFTEHNDDAAVGENVQVLSDEAVDEGLLSVSEDGNIYIFDGTEPEIADIEVGDVLVSAVGEGFLREVTGVDEENGELVIETAQANLEDVVENGALDVKMQLKPDADEKMMLAEGVKFLGPKDGYDFSYAINNVVLYDVDLNPLTTNDQVRMNGSIDFSASSEIYAEYEWFTLVEYLSTQTVRQRVQIEFVWDAGFRDVGAEYPIVPPHHLPAIEAYVGVPVVILPVITVQVGVNGSVEGNTRFKYTMQLRPEGRRITVI